MTENNRLKSNIIFNKTNAFLQELDYRINKRLKKLKNQLSSNVEHPNFAISSLVKRKGSNSFIEERVRLRPKVAEGIYSIMNTSGSKVNIHSFVSHTLCVFGSYSKTALRIFNKRSGEKS